MRKRGCVYLDYQATTPVDPRVVEAMQPYFFDFFGNAASRQHAFGREAEQAVETAREQIAALINARPEEIIFTSGATESNNLALQGLMQYFPEKHVVTSAVEHPSVLACCQYLHMQGHGVTYVPPDAQGRIAPHAVAAAMTPETGLVSVMYANHEVGTINPVALIAQVARARQVAFHTDATQAVGKISVDVQRDHIDLMSFSAHKLYGPKGMGALFVRRGDPELRLAPLLHGGGHEQGLRSGTLNVAGIVGFGLACEICAQEMDSEAQRLRGLRDELAQRIIAAVPQVTINGHPNERLPGNLNISFAHVDAEALMMALTDVAVSSGAACASLGQKASTVLTAMGLSERQIKGSIRFGIGRFSSSDDIQYVARRVIEAVAVLREQSPLWRLEQDRS